MYLSIYSDLFDCFFCFCYVLSSIIHFNKLINVFNMHDYFFVVKINYIRQGCYITAETVLSQKKKIIIRMLIQSVTKFLPLVYSLSYYAFLLQKIYKIIKMFFTYCICSNYVKSHNDVHSIYLIKKTNFRTIWNWISPKLFFFIKWALFKKNANAILIRVLSLYLKISTPV